MWDLKQKHFKYFYIFNGKDTKLVPFGQHIWKKRSQSFWFSGNVISLQYGQNIAFLINNLTGYLYVRQYAIITILL